MRVFSARACAAPLEKAAELFQERTGIRVQVDIVELPRSQEAWRGTGVGLLKFSKQPDAARRFMDFLASAEARRFYEEYGWCLPGAAATAAAE